MENKDILDRITAKGAAFDLLADQLIEDGESIPNLIDALRVETSSKKFSYEKVLRLISEKRPRLIYPFFDYFCGLLDHENNFLKWGAVRTLANLTAADSERQFEAIFRKYFAPITGPAMITAANIISGSVVIAGFKPALINEIVREILRVEHAEFLIKGRSSPECRNVAIGHAIHAFDKLYDQISNKTEVTQFVKRQLENPRKPVATKAAQFIRRHG
jgi:hypothetical protein